jgi:hypothetical protein
MQTQIVRIPRDSLQIRGQRADQTRILPNTHDRLQERKEEIRHLSIVLRITKATHVIGVGPMYPLAKVVLEIRLEDSRRNSNAPYLA